MKKLLGITLGFLMMFFSLLFFYLLVASFVASGDGYWYFSGLVLFFNLVVTFIGFGIIKLLFKYYQKKYMSIEQREVNKWD